MFEPKSGCIAVVVVLINWDIQQQLFAYYAYSDDWESVWKFWWLLSSAGSCLEEF